MPLDLPKAGPDVVGKTWDEFLEWWRRRFEPGQHAALIGVTGCGKSTAALQLLDHRKYVLALDAKGGDSTLAKTGWPRLTAWPPSSKVWDEIAEGRPARFVVGWRTRTTADRRALVALLRETLEGAFETGGFTVYADEFQLLADRKLMGLGALVEEMLIAARDRGTSVLTSYQAPAWVPTAASRQATYIFLWPTRNINVIKALADAIGRDWRMLWSVMQRLPAYHMIVITRDPFDPLIVTKAPRM